VEKPSSLAASTERADASNDPLLEQECARLRRELERAVTRVCPRWLTAQADDIVQVALVRVIEAHRRREGPEPLSTFYLKRAAYNATIDEIRKRRRRREVPLDDTPGADAPSPAAPVDPERTQQSAEIGLGIQDCLARLVESRRLAVTLYLQGHNVPETGRILGWGTKRVENLVFRGLADLRQCLVSKGYQP